MCISCDHAVYGNERIDFHLWATGRNLVARFHFAVAAHPSIYTHIGCILTCARLSRTLWQNIVIIKTVRPPRGHRTESQNKTASYAIRAAARRDEVHAIGAL